MWQVVWVALVLPLYRSANSGAQATVAGTLCYAAPLGAALKRTRHPRAQWRCVPGWSPNRSSTTGARNPSPLYSRILVKSESSERGEGAVFPWWVAHQRSSPSDGHIAGTKSGIIDTTRGAPLSARFPRLAGPAMVDFALVVIGEHSDAAELPIVRISTPRAGPK